ncbi:hypothetical protein DV515_00018359 [Chloebia gouldiae]|uniref:Uncharacterized protein n=1 Tax=Chloebia gouldiae TaxID=44316 RepID=A0A3L8Q7Z9_CHLGU|nr:hypothetical protein DV515_00018362 [Chloebia gouldiae]RLV63352.1 hypothetical protein DV515_00018359 [Chloebia gouldiae]
MCRCRGICQWKGGFADGKGGFAGREAGRGSGRAGAVRGSLSPLWALASRRGRRGRGERSGGSGAVGAELLQSPMPAGHRCPDVPPVSPCATRRASPCPQLAPGLSRESAAEQQPRCPKDGLGALAGDG